MNQATPTDIREMADNVLILHQDDIFTLAYYLLGDEEHAVQAAQSAVQRVYRRSVTKPARMRIELLRQTVCQARKVLAALPKRHRQPVDPTLARLELLAENERTAAVLVDILGLSYHEAAEVLDCSPKQAGRLLAQARLSISRQLRPQ